ncbi:TPA: HNH endonuclease [Bacillus pseudomycoides]|nr:HNH endonuclease [Bacillus pseudomycoides]
MSAKHAEKIELETKVCSRCREEKPVIDFALHHKYGYQWYCRSCDAESKSIYDQTPQGKASRINRNGRNRVTRNNTFADITNEQVRALIERFDSCMYCGKSLAMKTLQIDHVVPMSFAGPHRIDNLVVCCGECNRVGGKGDMSIFEYYRQNADFTMERLEVIINYLAELSGQSKLDIFQDMLWEDMLYCASKKGVRPKISRTLIEYD